MRTASRHADAHSLFRLTPEQEHFMTGMQSLWFMGLFSLGLAALMPVGLWALEAKYPKPPMRRAA